MRDGNSPGMRKKHASSIRLNEGWPECGMETSRQFCSLAKRYNRLNEGWPECGMETTLINTLYYFNLQSE